MQMFMKGIKYILTVTTVAVSLISCTKISNDTIISEEKVVLSASIADVNTKTTVDGVDVKWSATDKIAVYSDVSYTTGEEYALTSGSGEKKALFSGNAIEGTKYLAVFPYSSAKYFAVGKSVRISTPSEQTYVPNGISSDLLPMIADGNSLENMQFQYLGGILRIKLYATDGTQISKITFTPIEPSQAVRYTDFYVNSNWGTINPYGGKPSENSIVLNCTTPVTLSSNSENPTVFNIVYGNYFTCDGGFHVTVTSTTDKKMLLSKTGKFDFQKGKILTFNAIKFVDNLSSSNKVIVLDGGTEEELYSCTGTPISSVKVITKNDELLTAADIEKIISIVEKASTAIELDFSGSNYTSTTFCPISSNKIKSIKLPSNIAVLPDLAFNMCKELVDIDLNGVKKIGTYAFDYCALTTIHIPASVTTISNNWISYYGSKVTEFTVDDANAYFKAIDGVLFSKDGTLLKEYPRAKTGTAYTIPDGTKNIQNYAFHLTQIENLTIPASVTTINNCATNKIKYIKCLGDTPATFKGNNLPDNGTLEVPTGKGQTYKEKWSWLETKGWTVSDGTSTSPAVAIIDDIPTTDIESEGFWN